MGLAVGAMGMSLRDFCSLTPEEFRAVVDEWQSVRVRQPWEQTRLLACCLLQPWSRKTLRPTDVIRLPWDKKEDVRKTSGAQSTRSRFEEMRQRAGM